LNHVFFPKFLLPFHFTLAAELNQIILELMKVFIYELDDDGVCSKFTDNI